MTAKPTTKKPATPAAPPPGQDLQAFLAQLGISADGLGGGLDPSDPPVWTAPEQFNWRKGSRPKLGRPRPSSEAYLDFYRMSDAEVRKWQERFFDAGFYGGAEASDIPWGDHDENTFQLWQQFVNRAAGFYAVGQMRTPQQVAMEAVGKAGTGKGGPKSQRAPLVLQIPNPDDLGAVATEAARATLGRKATDEEVAAFVSDFQGRVTNFQRQEYAADERGGSVVAPPSAQTAAETFARERNPVEAGSHDLADVYGRFLGILGVT